MNKTKTIPNLRRQPGVNSARPGRTIIRRGNTKNRNNTNKASTDTKEEGTGKEVIFNINNLEKTKVSGVVTYKEQEKIMTKENFLRVAAFNNGRAKVLATKVSKLQRKVDSRGLLIDKANEKLKNYYDEIKEYKKKISELNQKQKNYENDKEYYLNRILVLKKNIDVEIDKKDDLEESLDKKKKKLKKTKKNYKKLQKELKGLRKVDQNFSLTERPKSKPIKFDTYGSFGEVQSTTVIPLQKKSRNKKSHKSSNSSESTYTQPYYSTKIEGNMSNTHKKLKFKTQMGNGSVKRNTKAWMPPTSITQPRSKVYQKDLKNSMPVTAPIDPWELIRGQPSYKSYHKRGVVRSKGGLGLDSMKLQDIHKPNPEHVKTKEEQEKTLQWLGFKEQELQRTNKVRQQNGFPPLPTNVGLMPMKPQRF